MSNEKAWRTDMVQRIRALADKIERGDRVVALVVHVSDGDVVMVDGAMHAPVSVTSVGTDEALLFLAASAARHFSSELGPQSDESLLS